MLTTLVATMLNAGLMETVLDVLVFVVMLVSPPLAVDASLSLALQALVDLMLNVSQEEEAQCADVQGDSLEIRTPDADQTLVVTSLVELMQFVKMVQMEDSPVLAQKTMWEVPTMHAFLILVLEMCVEQILIVLSVGNGQFVDVFVVTLDPLKAGLDAGLIPVQLPILVEEMLNA